MMQKRAKITSKGQITVPREIRRLLGVRAGDGLLFESDDSGTRVFAARQESPFSKYRGLEIRVFPLVEGRSYGRSASCEVDDHGSSTAT